MQISNRFTIAIHILPVLSVPPWKMKYKITSDFLADSVNVNPVVIRKILSQLKGAGLIDVRRGSGGASWQQSRKMNSTAGWAAQSSGLRGKRRTVPYT